MNEKEFKFKVSYTFTGVVKIKADNRMIARQMAKDHVGLVIGGNIHSSLPDDMVDWDFPVHPEKKVVDKRNG